MNFYEAAILGVIEGLTEFIPVSSTGHLILFNELLGIHGEHAASFDIVIQLGAILAVVVLYWKRFMALLDFTKGETPRFAGVRGIGLLAVAAIPALGVGYLFGDVIKEHLFNTTSVALALIVGGVALIGFDKERKDPVTLDTLTYKHALTIGLFQVFSLWPGFSRAGSTIIGGLFSGLTRRTAAEFSFLLAVPVLGAACGYELLKEWSSFSSSMLVSIAIGFGVSFIVGFLAIKFFIGMLQRFSMRPIAYYRIILGVLVLLLLK